MTRYVSENREKIAKNKAAQGRTMQGRHTHLLQRHKYKLAPRGVEGRPMSLKTHQKKLYFADGRERPSQGIAKVRIGGATYTPHSNREHTKWNPGVAKIRAMAAKHLTQNPIPSRKT